MKIKAAIRTYDVHFEETLDFLNNLIRVENAFFVIDKNIWVLYKAKLESIPEQNLYVLDATEEKKVIETALDICERIVSMNAKRNVHLISIGGGITQDLTGFAANVLYRGIAWTFVPTTLLAACDSCIGGKTSLNYKSFKNLLGTFYPPNDIYICPDFFKTLSKHDLESGLGEVVKFNVMGGEETLRAIEVALPKLLALDPKTVNAFVHNSLQYKKAIIEEDEFDGGKRVLLNFAHTFGHAFEVSSQYVVPHGSAVALGLVAANSVSIERGYLSKELDARIRVLVNQITPSFSPDYINSDIVLAAIRKDKKQTEGDEKLTAVLLDDSLNLRVVHNMKEIEVRMACDVVRRFLASK